MILDGIAEVKRADRGHVQREIFGLQRFQPMGNALTRKMHESGRDCVRDLNASRSRRASERLQETGNATCFSTRRGQD
jgi:hypothetical protein